MLLYQQNNRSCVFAVVPLTVEISPSLEKRFVFGVGDLQLKKTLRGVCAAWYRCLT